jgi:hypothetical protein
MALAIYSEKFGNLFNGKSAVAATPNAVRFQKSKVAPLPDSIAVHIKKVSNLLHRQHPRGQLALISYCYFNHNRHLHLPLAELQNKIYEPRDKITQDGEGVVRNWQEISRNGGLSRKPAPHPYRAQEFFALTQTWPRNWAQ